MGLNIKEAFFRDSPLGIRMADGQNEVILNIPGHKLSTGSGKIRVILSNCYITIGIRYCTVLTWSKEANWTMGWELTSMRRPQRGLLRFLLGDSQAPLFPAWMKVTRNPSGTSLPSTQLVIRSSRQEWKNLSKIMGRKWWRLGLRYISAQALGGLQDSRPRQWCRHSDSPWLLGFSFQNRRIRLAAFKSDLLL